MKEYNFTFPEDKECAAAIAHHAAELQDQISDLSEEEAEFLAESIYEAWAPTFHEEFTKPKRALFMKYVGKGVSLKDAAADVSAELRGEEEAACNHAAELMDEAIEQILAGVTVS